ncbi:MAG: tRNA uridine-5-carboxymethylaminomethyl(34) synthesis enzyme MnmG [Clostridia bacterium]|nr:tRNA uridine-5-carboxymethylaminomethyl(34) synthesis enzyme MnmG [Clostridia bacterium]MBQ9785795.1 tRNA uridine-5-carboxymethylaminomethyl(34) synthesis enzyme MnmG [Clostridia bacterium]
MSEQKTPSRPHLSCRVAVIGAGHAGIEAALAAARMGVDTVLFTMSFESIANLPCNPSIGGTAKGHLVYEIDALGGEMGRAADLVTLQSRTLNLGKGAAVQSKRVQADRKQYQSIMKRTLESTPNLRLVQAEITAINVSDSPNISQESTRKGAKYVSSVTTRLGEIWQCDCVIVASGTYLESEIFVGSVNYEAGPDGFLPAKGLSASLRDAGIKLLRFKTGTPARIKKETIDLSRLEEQPGEGLPLPYSAQHREDLLYNRKQIPCHIVYTNAETHRIIRENITRSALYSGKIHGTGPRYCPSIEDKLVRFADKERHQLFVEPMGEDTSEMYLQGFSTSLPTDVQSEMLHSLEGFENAEIMRYAYAIEYDCADPTQMDASLEFKSVKGLFGAGQFNGTSGYEEAAAQGLVAGINAARSIKGLEPVILPRSGSYIGTLIDDLVTKGTNEPYRMMTSRSEYRLLLRQDNADQRLTPIGYEAGLVTEVHYQAFLSKKAAIDAEKERLEHTYVSPDKANAILAELGETPLKSGASLADLLRRPAVSYEILAHIDENRPTLPRTVRLTVETDVKYAGYANRQLTEIEQRRRLEEKRLPPEIDYSAIKGLRIEAAQKLSAMRPLTVGQASRISGVSPADITVLLIYLGMK